MNEKKKKKKRNIVTVGFEFVNQRKKISRGPLYQKKNEVGDHIKKKKIIQVGILKMNRKGVKSMLKSQKGMF